MAISRISGSFSNYYTDHPHPQQESKQRLNDKISRLVYRLINVGKIVFPEDTIIGSSFRNIVELGCDRIHFFRSAHVQTAASIRNIIFSILGIDSHLSRHFWGRFTLRSPEEISGNPLRILLELGRYRNKKFPNISYRENSGIDIGGVRRDFMTQLFSAIFRSSCLPISKSEDGSLPFVINDPNFSLSNQIKMYKTMGFLFKSAIVDELPIGFGFHPALFDLVHTCLETGEEIPNNLKSIDDIPKHVQKRLFLAFAKSKLGFGDDEEGPLAIWENNSEYLENLGMGTREEIFEDQKINETILAAALIAKGMGPIKKDKRHLFESGEQLRKAVEGTISKEEVIKSIQGDPKSCNYLKRWVENASNQELEDLIYSATGSRTLPKNGQINVRTSRRMDSNQEYLPTFHTCFSQIEVPQYHSYAQFANKLSQSVQYGAQGGFQMN